MTSRPSRSLSVGAVPRVKPLLRSRADSASGGILEVRCACQYFQSDSLLPERINPVGDSRPTSPIGSNTSRAAYNISHDDKLDKLLHQAEDSVDFRGSILGIVTATDYYAETESLSRPTSNTNLASPRLLPQNSLNNSTLVSMPGATSVKKTEFNSQCSLDKWKNSSLLQRYNKRARSQDLNGSNVELKVNPIQNVTTGLHLTATRNAYNSEQASDTEPNYRHAQDLPQYKRNSNFDVRIPPAYAGLVESLNDLETTNVQMGIEYPVDKTPSTITTVKPEFSSQHGLNRMRTSSLLQKYNKRSSSQDPPSYTNDSFDDIKSSRTIKTDENPMVSNQYPLNESTQARAGFSSQKSLDKMKNSSLLQRYNKRAMSQDQPRYSGEDLDSRKKIQFENNIAMNNQHPTENFQEKSDLTSQKSLERLKKSSLLQRYDKRPNSQDRQSVFSTEKMENCRENLEFSSQKNLDRLKTSSLLQRYDKRAISQDRQPVSNIDITSPILPTVTAFSSQQNLEKLKRSSLLQKYNKRANSPDRPANTFENVTNTKTIVDGEFSKIRPIGSLISNYDTFDYRMSPIMFEAIGKINNAHGSR
jgi:hypothetical protein